jgi:PE-PPE domain-containing protein
MRKSARAIGIIVVSLIASVALGIASAFTAAFAFGATALIVPGTGTPNATNVGQYMENARDYYMGGTACANGGCTDADLHSIVYPASFYPLSFIPGWCDTNCQKWDVSVQQGVDDLNQKLMTALADPNEHVVIFGYSQGGAVVSNELRALKDTLTEEQKARIEMVQIGSIDNPVGGLWTLLGFLGHVPLIDVTTGLPTPTDSGIPFTSIVFQYDGVSNSPIAWGNLLAVANAFAGFDQIHGTYLDPNENGDFTGLPDGYTPAELQAALNDPANIKFDARGNKYVTVPTKVLPLASLILGLASTTGTTQIVKPFVDLFSPLAKVIIDLAYDPNANPGVPRWLTILPIAYIPNPVKLAFDLAAATVQGVQAFLNDLGFGGLVAPVAPAPAPLTTSTLAARSIAPQADAPEADASASLASVTELASAKKSTPAEPETDAVDVTDAVPAEGTEATTPATEPASTETTKPVETTTPTETTKPTETAKPEETTKPTESTKPEETTKPSDTKSDETTKPSDTKPDESTKPSDTKPSDASGDDKKDASKDSAADKKDASDAGTKAAA